MQYRLRTMLIVLAATVGCSASHAPPAPAASPPEAVAEVRPVIEPPSTVAVVPSYVGVSGGTNHMLCRMPDDDDSN